MFRKLIAQDIDKDLIVKKVLESVNYQGQLFYYATKYYEAERYVQEEKDAYFMDLRTDFMKDTGRILHSSSYYRQNKTQVHSITKNDLITRREDHVQLVSNVARVICKALGLNEELAEAISLAHDLGHTPLGHDGEEILDELCKLHDIGGFSHSTQSFRLLMFIEKDGRGLNLTRQVLDGVISHNGEIVAQAYHPDRNKDWAQLLREYQMTMEDASLIKKLTPGTLEAAVMRISDIIAYLGRDIYDAVLLKILKLNELPVSALDDLGVTGVIEDNRGLSDLRIAHKLNSAIIKAIQNDLVLNSFGKEYLVLSDKVYRGIKTLKDYNYLKIYTNPRVKVDKKQREQMFSYYFDKYYYELKNSTEQSPLTEYYQRKSEHYKASTPLKRVVVDYIASMSDDYFFDNLPEKLKPDPKKYYLGFVDTLSF